MSRQTRPGTVAENRNLPLRTRRALPTETRMQACAVLNATLADLSGLHGRMSRYFPEAGALRDEDDPSRH